MPKTVEQGKTGELRSAISRAVRMRRADKRLSQQDVAELAGVSVVRISEIEGETKNPRIDTIEKVANALGIVVRFEAA